MTTRNFWRLKRQSPIEITVREKTIAFSKFDCLNNEANIPLDREFHTVDVVAVGSESMEARHASDGV